MSGCWEAVTSREEEDIFAAIAVFHTLYLITPVFAVIQHSYQWCSPNSPLSYTSAPKLVPVCFHHVNWSCVTKSRIWVFSCLDEILTSHCCQLNRGEKQRKKKKERSSIIAINVAYLLQNGINRNCLGASVTFLKWRKILWIFMVLERWHFFLYQFSPIFLHCCCTCFSHSRTPKSAIF